MVRPARETSGRSKYGHLTSSDFRSQICLIKLERIPGVFFGGGFWICNSQVIAKNSQSPKIVESGDMNDFYPR